MRIDLPRRQFLVRVGLASLAGGLASAQSPLKVVAIADLNDSYGSVGYDKRVSRAIERIAEMKPAAVLIAGDMIAGQRPGHPLSQTQLQDSWQAFDQVIVNPLRSAGIPVAPSPGNHDASSEPTFHAEREAYARHWQSNRPAVTFLDDASYPFNYAVQVGSANFISVDAVEPAELSGPTRTWLETTLARLDEKNKNSPTVVFGHLPLNPVAHGREREYLHDQALRALLAKHRVTAYVSGHHHAFYYGCSDGVRQVFLGALGAGPRALIHSPGRAPHSFAALSLKSRDGVEVESYRDPHFDRLIDIDQLPAEISLGDRRVGRADTAGGCG